jgi:hypothetical protein
MAGPPLPPLPPPGAMANRTDLAVPGAPQPGPAPGMGQPNGQPITTPTGLPYGENKDLQQAQAAVPLAGGGGNPQGLPPSQAPAGLPPSGGGGIPPTAMDSARQYQMPDLGLMAPTARPHEPVTAGLTSGPGAGPSPQSNNGSQGLAAMLTRMAQMSDSPALGQLASRAQALNQ